MSQTERKIFYGSNARLALFSECLRFKAELEIEDSKVFEKALVGGSNGSVQHLFNVVKDLTARLCKIRDFAHDHDTAWLPMDGLMSRMREAHTADFAESKRRAKAAREQDEVEESDVAAAG